MAQRQKGHIYGLKTKKGVAILQLAEEPETPTSLQLTRVCDGFLEGEYTDADILRIVRRPERFFLETPLRAIGPRSRVYREFFAFDRPFALPDRTGWSCRNISAASPCAATEAFSGIKSAGAAATEGL